MNGSETGLKMLAWDDSDWRRPCADTSVGEVSIQTRGGDIGEWVVCYSPHWWRGESPVFKTSDAAKAWAQSKFSAFTATLFKDAAPPPQSAASTVEPVAFRWQGANGVWHLEKEQSESSDYEPLYAATTTSPEPTERCIHEVPLTVECGTCATDYGDNRAVYVKATSSPNPVVADYATTETPEPDAVREALEKARDKLIEQLGAGRYRANFAFIDAALARNDRARPQPITDGAEK